jgi:hypothetical protein
MDEFEFWFGKTDAEFVRMLNYPKLPKLLKLRQGELRMKRAPDIIRRREERQKKGG